MLRHNIKWADKTAVITGSGSGIGRAVAIALAKRGATLHLIDRHPERITALVEQLSIEPGVCSQKVHGHAIDVTHPEKLQQLVTHIQSKVDILINCAGILHQGKLGAATHRELHQVIDVNLWGAIYSIKAFLPHMKKPNTTHRGQCSHIINIASIAGLIGAPEMAIYNASKSAILGLTESLAIELAADNIHVSAVCPGSVNTNLGRDGRFSSESTAAQILRRTIRSGVEPMHVAQDIIHVIEHTSLFKLSCVELHWQILWLCKRLFPSLYPKLASTIYHNVLDKGWLNLASSQKTNVEHCL
ncbi:MAG: SDR family oxidoreductase [Cyanobacteria bacterium J06621_11]